MRKVITKIGAILASALLIGTWFVAPAISGSGRDCDGNAVIQCGALTTTELYQKLRDGASGPNQSAAELRSLFGKFQIWTSEFGNLKNGRVTKGNAVIVGDKIVGRDVLSMGRHYMPGSTQVAGINYPLYLRHPAVSFNATSLDAFVMLNSDGSLRYAVIKSCGNIVIPTQAPAPRYKLKVHKYIDANGNGRPDAGERPMANVAFTANNGEGTRTLRTNANGDLEYTNMPGGRWSVREWVPDGWRNTSPNPMVITLASDRTIYFGNAQIQRLGGLRIEKFRDDNENGTRDGSEPMLSGWSFTITGPNGYTNTVTTEANGTFVIGGLTPGRYVITENLTAGWVNTTGLTRAVDVLDDQSANAVFGNNEIPENRGSIIIQKFEDVNGDRTRNSDENMLSGWTFRVAGPDFDREVATDANGQSLITNLAPGRYIVTEINQDGWENTTGLVVTEDVDANEAQVYVFGNRRTTTPPPPGGGETTTLPVSGPLETAAATGGAMTFSGAILAWIRSKRNLLDAIRRK